MMIEKKGIMKHLVSVIIAVIVLGIIVVAGFKIYELSVDRERRNAENVLESFVAKVDSMDEGESRVLTIGPLSDWYLLGWNKEDSGKPGKCGASSCVCACPLASAETSVFSQVGDDYSGKFEERKALHSGECQSEGVCLELEYDKVDVRAWGESILIYDGGNAVNLRSYIGLENRLVDIEVEKDSEGIEVIQYIDIPPVVPDSGSVPVFVF